MIAQKAWVRWLLRSYWLRRLSWECSSKSCVVAMGEMSPALNFLAHQPSLALQRRTKRDSSSDCLSARRLWEFLSLPLLHPLTLSLTWDSQTCCSVLTEVMKTQWVAVGGRTCLKSLEPPKHTTVHLEVMFNRERKWEQKKKKNTHKTVARE